MGTGGFIHLGYRQRDALDSLQRSGKMSIAGLSEDCGMDYWTAWSALEALRRHGLVQRDGRRPLPNGAGSLPWEYEITPAGVRALERRRRLGLVGGVQSPPGACPKRNRTTEQESLLADRVLESIEHDGPATTLELSERLRKSQGYVRNVVCALHKIGMLTRSRSRPPVYRLAAAPQRAAPPSRRR